MPTVVLNKDIFEKLVGKSLPIDELKDRISMLGTDLEKIEENEIHVEVFPNRPDMLSEQGFARAFSSFIGINTGLKHYDIKDSGQKVIIDPSVLGIRPFTACALVKGLKFDDEKIREVIQIQEKLHITYGRNRKKLAIGIYPLEKIKLPIRYFAADPDKILFQPLESDKPMTARQILSKHPAGREYGHLLDGCSTFPFFIDANDDILSMPPIINSHNTGKISGTTEEVFVECSGFDQNTLSICLNIIITALADMGGQVYSMDIEHPKHPTKTPDLAPKPVEFDLDYTNRLLGLSLSHEDAVSLLAKMGHGFDNSQALVPAYRSDILHKIDLVEDIAIAYGYENFNEEIPNISTVGQESPFEIFKKKIADILIGTGLLETNTFHLTNKIFNNQNMCVELDVIELENALTEEYNSLRSWMIPCLLKVLSDNKHHELPHNLFEMGDVFIRYDDKNHETGVIEPCRLAVCLCSNDSDFTRIKQVFDSLASALDIEYVSEEVDHPSFIPGRVARLSYQSNKIAYIGEVSPQVLENWGIEAPVACFELNLSELYKEFQQKE